MRYREVGINIIRQTDRQITRVKPEALNHGTANLCGAAWLFLTAEAPRSLQPCGFTRQDVVNCLLPRNWAPILGNDPLSRGLSIEKERPPAESRLAKSCQDLGLGFLIQKPRQRQDCITEQGSNAAKQVRRHAGLFTSMQSFYGQVQSGS